MFLGGVAVLAWLGPVPDLAPILEHRPTLPTRVLDRRGDLVAEWGGVRRNPVDLDALPGHVIDAFIAAEDARFFQHGGIDPAAMIRAAWANTTHGRVLQGASTITQQAVKNVLLSPDRTMRRKVMEAALALRLERQVDKRGILEVYLNEVYLGSGAYGVEAAAREYFGKEAGRLDLSESALLAGLPQRPSAYSPRVSAERAESRRRYVLRRMLDEGFIDGESFEEARRRPPRIRPRRTADEMRAADWFLDEVRRRALRHVGPGLESDGLEVETTLDLDLQVAAHRAVRRGLEEVDLRHGFRAPRARMRDADLAALLLRLGSENDLSPLRPQLPDRPLTAVVVEVDPATRTTTVALALERIARLEAPRPIRERLEVGDRLRVRPARPAMSADARGSERVRLAQEPRVQGALVAIEADTGEVLALVGGYRYGRSFFNRATQARRPPGSAFKPFVYGAAIEQGRTATSRVVDRPFLRAGWAPRNHDRRFRGSLTLRQALARSANNATIHLLDQVGVSAVAGFAARLGIRSPLASNLTLALGTSPLTPIELTSAYAALAAGGRAHDAHLIRRIRDRRGRILYEAPPPDPGKVALAPAVAYVTGDLLRGAVTDPGATGRGALALPHFVAGKTGTTNDLADAWFVGFSPQIAAGVWVGYDRGRVLRRGESGGRTALPIWSEFMEEALHVRGPGRRAVPESVVIRRVDADTGLLADAVSRRSYEQAFVRGTGPARRASRILEARLERQIRFGM